MKLDLKILFILVVILFLSVFFVILVGTCQWEKNQNSQLPKKESLTSTSTKETYKQVTVPDTEELIQHLTNYENKELGISFQYPEAYKDNNCFEEKKNEKSTAIRVGQRIYVEVQPYSGQTLNLQKMDENLEEVITDIREEKTLLKGQKALKIEYRSIGMGGPYGTKTYVIYNKKLYVFTFDGMTDSCGFGGPIYDKILETVKFE